MGEGAFRHEGKEISYIGFNNIFLPVCRQSFYPESAICIYYRHVQLL